MKYRRQPAQGGGLDYITPNKLRRMSFAAEIWLQHHSWDADYRLQAAAVSGEGCEEIELTEI